RRRIHPDPGISQCGTVPSDNRVADIEVTDIQPSGAAAIRSRRGIVNREAVIEREAGDVGASQAGRCRFREPIRKDKALVLVSLRSDARGEAREAAGSVEGAPGDSALGAAGDVVDAPCDS